MAPIVPSSVVVHPLVLLSTVDHYNRVARDTKKRVVGVLLGSTFKGHVDVTNSYAVPFDEDDRNPNIWFLDHNFHENMFSMFKKVNARENVVGWYSTGPKIRASDISIHSLFQRYTPNPVLVIIDVQPKEIGIPTKAYVAVSLQSESSSLTPSSTLSEGENQQTFQHISSSIGALEAEEVGVEHLLRDIKDTSISRLAQQVNNKQQSLRSLATHLTTIRQYLDDVANGKLPINHAIVSNVQDIFNLLPNLNVDALVRSFIVKSNDMMLTIYVASLIRSIIALHTLINNKIANRNAEKNAEAASSAASTSKDNNNNTSKDNTTTSKDSSSSTPPNTPPTSEK